MDIGGLPDRYRGYLIENINSLKPGLFYDFLEIANKRMAKIPLWEIASIDLQLSTNPSGTRSTIEDSSNSSGYNEYYYKLGEGSVNRLSKALEVFSGK